MRTVLHIDGLSNEPMTEPVYLPPGTLLDWIKQLGGTVRFEYLPDLPPVPAKLSPGAEDFIRSYQPEEADSVLAVFWRYHSLEAEEFETEQEAKGFLEGGEEYETLAGEAIVVGDQIAVWN